MTVVSFDKLFPVDGLPPESFERFCQALLEELYPEAEATVHAVGGVGSQPRGGRHRGGLSRRNSPLVSVQTSRPVWAGEDREGRAEHTRQATKK